MSNGFDVTFTASAGIARDLSYGGGGSHAWEDPGYLTIFAS
jgi:hypothetical protein